MKSCAPPWATLVDEFPERYSFSWAGKRAALDPDEDRKVRCTARHFREAFWVSYEMKTSAGELQETP